jgi:ferritin-like metal-binding protein YciE
VTTRALRFVSPATKEVQMADKRRDDVLAWLRDAHAMEAATVDNLEKLIGTVDDYPALQAQLRSHLTASRRQREEIERQLERLGEDTSKLKDWVMKAGGNVQPVLSWFTPDTVPKNCLAAYAYEKFEIASYRSLMGAADELGLSELRQMCERFIAEEKQFADFLFEQLPAITRQYLAGRAA